MPTLLANAPNTRAQVAPGDCLAPMLPRGDYQAATVSEEKLTGAHHCPRVPWFLHTHTHTLASSKSWEGLKNMMSKLAGVGVMQW